MVLMEEMKMKGNEKMKMEKKDYYGINFIFKDILVKTQCKGGGKSKREGVKPNSLEKKRCEIEWILEVVCYDRKRRGKEKRV